MKQSLHIMEDILKDDYNGEIIYHYTSAEGLLGIIRDQKSWCTHAYFLNDFEEIINGWELFFQALEIYKNNPKYSEFTHFIEPHFKNWKELNFKERSYDIFNDIKMSNFRTFIFSASYKKDDLNQWRSYTNGTNGFCIGLKFDGSFRVSSGFFPR